MSDPIRDALERLVAADRFIGEAGPEYQQARDAAHAVLAAAPEDGSAFGWQQLCAELLRGLDESRHPEVRYPGHLRVVMAAARAALAAPTMPAREAAMSDTARAVLQRHVAAFRVPGQSLPVQERIAMAEEALAAPTPPADEEAEVLAKWLEKLITHPVDVRTRIDRFFIDQIRRAATMLRQLPPKELEAVRYSVADDDVTIQRTSKAPDSWAIYCGDLSMSVTGDWDLDPKLVSWPSRRTDEWRSTHRWPTLAAAWEALQQSRRQEESDD